MDKVIWQREYGVMNNSEIPKRKPTDQTVFPIASVSKVLTVSYVIKAARCVLNFIVYISHATTVRCRKSLASATHRKCQQLINARSSDICHSF